MGDLPCGRPGSLSECAAATSLSPGDPPHDPGKFCLP